MTGFHSAPTVLTASTLVAGVGDVVVYVVIALLALLVGAFIGGAR